MNEVNTTSNSISTNKVKHFQVVEGSNYKVTDSYGNEYIIDFDHFQKLNQSLFFGEGEFTTINNIVINKKYIFKIEPTRELTEAQAKAAEEKAMEYRKQEDRKNDLARIKNNFDVEFFNQKYGADKWVRWNHFNRQIHVHVINEDDMKASWSAFEKQYPKEAEEIKNYESTGS